MKRLIFVLLLITGAAFGQSVCGINNNCTWAGNHTYNGNLTVVPTSSNPLAIVAWGDSLTAGWIGVSNPGGWTQPLQTSLGVPVVNQGIGGQTSAQIKARFLADTQYRSFIHIFWEGRNDSDYTALKANIAAQVALVPAGQNYLVLGVLKNSGDIPGSAIDTLSSDLSTLYGSHYLDINAAVVAAYNPALPYDVSDHNNNIPPTSLRAITATGTLVSSIGTSDTSFDLTTTAGTFATNGILTIDNENMLVTNVVGATVTVTRNRGGTLAAHTAGAAVSQNDGLHLNADGAAVVAQAIATKLQSSFSPRTVWNQASLLSQMKGQFAALPFRAFDYLNTAGGANALQNVTSAGQWNAAFGANALRLNTSGDSNTAIGHETLSANTTGSKNTAVGDFALFLNQTGSSNTAVGNWALELTTSSSGTAVGDNALRNNTSGIQNTAVGAFSAWSGQTANNVTAVGYTALQFNTANESTAFGSTALQQNTTGIGNTAVGSGTLALNQTGAANTAVGLQALSKTTVSNNTAVGSSALKLDTTGHDNTAVGNQALAANVDGNVNTAVGTFALTSNTSGSSNTGLGYFALNANSTAANNTAVGYTALQRSNSANNTAVGYNSLNALTSGANNTAIGRDSGWNSGVSLQTNANSTFIGYNANASADALTNCTALGYQAQCTANNQVQLGNTSVTDAKVASRSVVTALYAGTTTTSANTAITAPRIIFGDVTLSSGTATVTGFSPAFTSTSSYNCTVSDTATTPAAASYQRTSASSITIKGGTTATVSYQCVGN